MSERRRDVAESPVDVWTGERQPVTWSFDPRDGVLQGPLKLSSFAGGALLLRLEPGQTALLIQDGAARRVWLAGTHLLVVASGPDTLPADASLFMLDTGTALACRWGDVSPLRLPEGGSARGRCAFRIAAPAKFYQAFLHHAETAGEGFVRRLLGSLMQARLERLLAASGALAGGHAALRALGPADFADGWDELGVTCDDFACDAQARAASRPRADAVVTAGAR